MRLRKGQDSMVKKHSSAEGVRSKAERASEIRSRAAQEKSARSERNENERGRRWPTSQLHFENTTPL